MEDADGKHSWLEAVKEILRQAVVGIGLALHEKSETDVLESRITITTVRIGAVEPVDTMAAYGLSLGADADSRISAPFAAAVGQPVGLVLA